MLPKDIIITNSSVAESEGLEGTIFPFNILEGYEKSVKRYQGTRLYEANTKIDPLAHYSWNALDSADEFAINLHTQTLVADPTSVPVVDGETIVYVYEDQNYYISKVTGNVDFTTEDIEDPSSFTLLTAPAPWRHEYYYPDQTPLIWKDTGATNRNRVADKAINTYSMQNTDEMWFEFETRGADSVFLFGLDASDVKITIYDTDINNPIYTNTKTNLIDTTSIIDWRTYSRFEPPEILNVNWMLPFLTGSVTIRITLSSDNPRNLRLGEILAGSIDTIGATLATVPATVKSSAQIIETPAGEIILSDEGDSTKVYELFTFSMKFPSEEMDSILKKCQTLIHKRIVITGEDTDEIEYRSLVIYGFAREASPTLRANWEKSNIKLQIQRFI